MGDDRLRSEPSSGDQAKFHFFEKWLAQRGLQIPRRNISFSEG
jgi:hypothetical protein